MKVGLAVGLVIVGDEILNGSRVDKHMSTLIGFLQARGLSLGWVRIVGDDHDDLVETYVQSYAKIAKQGDGKLVNCIFSCGGIGATPDDITRACAAEAANVDLVTHSEAKSLIENKFGGDAYPNRILMSELPEGAKIIPNPVNQVPGFSLEDHHFVPGFPNMAWPMMEWVLDHYYADFFLAKPPVDWRWDIRGQSESNLLEMMGELLSLHPDVRLSSLPNTKDRMLIDFGLKGDEQNVAEAAEWLEERLQAANISFKRRLG